MQQMIELNKIRFKTFFNYIIYNLIKTPSLISIFFIIPMFLYFTGELLVSSEIAHYSLNPNVCELIKSYNVFLFRLLYYIIIISGPIYFFMSKINIKSYYKYCHYKISFKDINNANYHLFLQLLDVFFLIVFLFILSHTESSSFSILVFFCMFFPSVNILILSLCYFYQLTLSLLLKCFKTYINISVLELLLVISFTYFSVSIIEGISLSTVINIPIIFILFSLISVFFIIKVLYKTIYLEGSVTIFNQRKSRSKVINFKGSINILKNYFLLLFNIKEIFLEYIFSFLIIFIIVIRTELKSSPEIIFQFIVLFSLISNGVIYSYKRWYSFHPKKIINTILKLDTVIFTITNILISTTISLIVLHEFKFDYIAFNFMTYILLTFIQKKLNLEYVNDGKSSVIFILLYGVISFVSFIILQNGVSLCINYLKG